MGDEDALPPPPHLLTIPTKLSSADAVYHRLVIR